MRPAATIRIYQGDEDTFQDVPFSYEYIVINGTIYVNFVEIRFPLFGKPDDMNTDIELAVAEALGVNPKRVTIDKGCVIKYSVATKTLAA